MGWPTPQDYNEAIQNPQFCFADPELKRGSPALTPLGLPRPITGAFASVYQLDCPDHRWAVRCFLREFDDQERRYSSISDHLRTVKLPCMVGFEFLAKGILVRGNWYPVLKMEWIDGEPLNEYVGRNLTQRQVLQSLARKWIDLMTSLRRAHIAHGDLQHGNILVSGGFLKLIDYDGMYVPALAGLASHEEGHRNYQHPGRTGRDFHPGLDDFSAWVIFTSISALAIDPRFWNLLNGGDECVLFRRADFEKPRASKALESLEKDGNLQLQALVSHFRSILCLPLFQVPSLDDSILQQPTNADQDRGHGRPTVSHGLPGWLGDYMKQPEYQAALEPLEAASDEARIGGAEWLYDHLVDDAPSVQPPPPIIQRRERVALRSFLGILGMMVTAWVFSWTSGGGLAMVVFLAFSACGPILLLGYRATSPAEERMAIRRRHQASRTALAEIEGVIGLSRLERARLGEPVATVKRAYDKLPQLMSAEAEQVDRDLARILDGIESRRRRAEKDHEKTLNRMEREEQQVDRNLATALEAIEVRRRQAEQEKEVAVKQLEQSVKKAVGSLVQKGASLDSEEKAEVDRLLQESQILHVKITLSKARLTATEVRGIGEALADRLHAAGVSCASDVTYDRVRKVPGIGDAKAAALVVWRQGVEQQAKRSASSSLSQNELSRIRGKYASSHRSIEQQIDSAKAEERRDRQQILQRNAASRRTLDVEDESARRAFGIQRDLLQAKNAKDREKAATEMISTRRALADEEESAKQDHGIQREAIKARFEREKSRLAAEFKAEKAKATEALKKLDEKLDQLNRSLFQRRLDLRQAERDLDRIKAISPMAYLRLVLLPDRVA